MKRTETSVLVVDLQERLATAMEPTALERVVSRTRALLEGARALSLPAFYTEQYPKGLGPTVEPLREALADVPRFEKRIFSALTDEVRAALASREGRPRVLVAGMETHVCVFQTARDLVEAGFIPYICADAVLSRTPLDREIGLELCRATGAVVTTVEAALLDLCGTSEAPEFKAVSRAIK